MREFSSRKIALACERNLTLLAIVGQACPDCRTISDFRKLHLEVFKDVLVQVGHLASEMGLVKLAMCRLLAQQFGVMRRVTRRCVMGIYRRK